MCLIAPASPGGGGVATHYAREMSWCRSIDPLFKALGKNIDFRHTPVFQRAGENIDFRPLFVP